MKMLTAWRRSDGEGAGPRWELYRILGEPVRLRLLALAADDELAIGELAELLGESQPNVSRHAAPLRQAGLLAVRKEGTRTLLHLAPGACDDPVVADAVSTGRALSEADGSLGRVAQLIAARDAASREFFARAPANVNGPAAEFGAYLSALGALLNGRKLAVDAGTGDGGLLDVLAPAFERVVAFDREAVQLARARERVALRGYDNVTFVEAGLGSPAVSAAARGSADAVFASRVLHHAPKPAAAVVGLAELIAPGGALVVIDYAKHDDEAMREQADLWLGFDKRELGRLVLGAGLTNMQSASIPAAFRGRGPDAHLPWQVVVARKALDEGSREGRPVRRKGNHHG